MKSKPILLAIAIVLIVASILYLESTKPKIEKGPIESDIEIEQLITNITVSLNETENVSGEPVLSEADIDRIKLKSEKYLRAKELVDPEGYINVDNITIAEHIGKDVILVDFWTYSCINCQRTLPYLTTWYEKYKDDGFILIGVHTPEFGFEEVYENVVMATKKWNVTYPVVQDNDGQTWRAYNNRYWPRKYLIDIDGFIVYDHIGEGGYAETEKKIQELLQERSEVLGLGKEIRQGISEVKAETPEFQSISTPEIYFGYGFERGQMGNPEGWHAEEIVEYSLPKTFDSDKFYLECSWKNNEDNMELVSDDGRIILKYNAKIVNLAAGSSEVKQIGGLLDGEDIGTIKVSDFDLYKVFEGDEYGEHTLELKVPKGVMVYTFTFG